MVLHRFCSVLCPHAARFSVVTLCNFPCSWPHSFSRVIFHVASPRRQVQLWDPERWEGRGRARCAACTRANPSSPLRSAVQECDTRDVPLWLFLKRVVKSSPFCLQVKTEICVLWLRADVRTQILCRSLGCSLGNDYHSFLPFVFLCG